MDDFIERLNRMTPAEKKAYQRQQTARIDAEQIQRLGYAASAEKEGREPVMTRYNEARADSTQPAIKEVIIKDRRTGRETSEFVGTGPQPMKSWMQSFMSPGQRQIGVYNGSTPEQEREFRQRMQLKIAAYDAALAGSR